MTTNCPRCKSLEKIIAEDLADTYLISIIAKIREVTGISSKPMLSELPEAIAEKLRQAQENGGNAKNPGC